MKMMMSNKNNNKNNNKNRNNNIMSSCSSDQYRYHSFSSNNDNKKNSNNNIRNNCCFNHSYRSVVVTILISSILELIVSHSAVAQAHNNNNGNVNDIGMTPFHVLTTLSPSREMPGTFQVSFATRKLNLINNSNNNNNNNKDKDDDIPAHAGVLYWHNYDSTSNNHNYNSSSVFVSSVATSYTHNGYDYYNKTSWGHYSSDWQHHAVIYDMFKNFSATSGGGEQDGRNDVRRIFFQAVGDVRNSSRYGEVSSIRIPSLSSTFGGKVEQKVSLKADALFDVFLQEN